CPIESVLESRFILLLDYLTTCSHNTLHRNICEPQERRMEWMPKRLLVTTAVAAALALPALAGLAQAADLASAVASADGLARADGYDGTVEAVRQTVVAAQVPGAVVALPVKAGDQVKAGQVLLRLDARAAEQQAGAAAAQVLAARAAQDAAT